MKLRVFPAGEAKASARIKTLTARLRAANVGVAVLGPAAQRARGVEEAGRASAEAGESGFSYPAGGAVAPAHQSSGS